MITPAIRYISSFQDNTNSSSIPVPTPLMVDGRIWDQKNLNVSTYRSGRVIPQVKTGWSTLTTGAWRYYNDNPASAAVYGRLYNWYALMGIYDAASLADPSLRDNIAPVGWEVATYGEWITLRNILGRSTAAIALKEEGPAHWGPTNTATNSSYFTALPGGLKTSSNNTTFNRLGSQGYWWQKDSPIIRYFYLTNDLNTLNVGPLFGNNASKNNGFSIRLIKQAGDIPGFATTFPTTITINSFLETGGNIPTSYSGNITERGVVYATTPNPTIANTRIISGDGTGSYTINITGLTINTQYYIRAYAVDSVLGIVYAPQVSPITLNSTPTLSTKNISQITTNSAESGGNIEDNGGFFITLRGVVWSTSPNPTIALTTKTVDGSGDGEFFSEITGLALNTKYYVRAYATNAGTTGYGEQQEFTTLAAVSLNLIFNQYPAYHAYSLRQLSDTYNYRCLRVRRTTTTPTTTTTTVDVFFNSYNEMGLDNDIRHVSGPDTLATNLGDFAAAAASGYTSNPDGVNINQDIFVVTWYDQSGNNKNVTRSNLTQQPRIVFQGNLEKISGKTAIRFSSSASQFLSLTDTSVPMNKVSSYAVGNSIALTNNAVLQLGSANNINTFFLPNASNISYRTANSFGGNGNVANQTRLYELICDISVANAYSNGNIIAPTEGVTSMTGNNSTIQIGLTSTSYMNGYIPEVISLIETPERINIEPNIMDYYGIQKSAYVTTNSVTNIEPTGTATSGGKVIDDFGFNITSRGICWSKNINPTISLSTKTSDGAGLGSFTSYMNYLYPSTNYYVKAYATNSVGTGYGNQVQFTTPAGDVLKYAYSLRRVVPGYTGPLIQVAKGSSTGRLVQDFPLIAGGELVQQDILNFVGPTSIGYVSKWYDQAGSGNTLGVANVVPGREPIIVENNAVNTKNNKIAIRFFAGFCYLRSVENLSIDLNSLSMFIVHSNASTAANLASPIDISSTKFPRPDTSGNDQFYYAGANRINLGPTNSDNKIYSSLSTPTTAEAWKNNVSLGSPVSISSVAIGTVINIGSLFVININTSFSGTIQEMLFYNGDVLSRTAITAEAMNYYSII